MLAAAAASAAAAAAAAANAATSDKVAYTITSCRPIDAFFTSFMNADAVVES
jgi:hypothetical protein